MAGRRLALYLRNNWKLNPAKNWTNKKRVVNNGIPDSARKVSRGHKAHQEEDIMTQTALDILVLGHLHAPKFLRITLSFCLHELQMSAHTKLEVITKNFKICLRYITFKNNKLLHINILWRYCFPKWNRHWMRRMALFYNEADLLTVWIEKRQLELHMCLCRARLFWYRKGTDSSVVELVRGPGFHPQHKNKRTSPHVDGYILEKGSPGRSPRQVLRTLRNPLRTTGMPLPKGCKCLTSKRCGCESTLSPLCALGKLFNSYLRTWCPKLQNSNSIIKSHACWQNSLRYFYMWCVYRAASDTQ